MKRPVRTTVIIGLLCALCAASLIPLSPAIFYGGTLMVRLFVFFNIAIYATLLCRWSGESPARIVLPLIFLTGLTLLPMLQEGFLLTALVIFCWIRSSVCNSEPSIRVILAECVTLAGYVGLALVLTPAGDFCLPVMTWLFYLMQALYFYIIPHGKVTESVLGVNDSFDRAYMETERILNGTEGGRGWPADHV